MSLQSYCLRKNNFKMRLVFVKQNRARINLYKFYYLDNITIFTTYINRAI